LDGIDQYGRIEVKVPLALGDEHPRIVVTVPNFGSAKIDPNKQNELEGRDDLKKTIKLKQIIIIQESKTTQDPESSQKRVGQRPIDNSLLPKM
jgi:hypothetical protein